MFAWGEENAPSRRFNLQPSFLFASLLVDSPITLLEIGEQRNGSSDLSRSQIGEVVLRDPKVPTAFLKG